MKRLTEFLFVATLIGATFGWIAAQPILAVVR